MNRNIFILTWLFFLPALFANADYRELRNEFETYAPPSYFRSKTRFQAEPVIKEPADDPGFTDEKRKIQEIKEIWERSLDVGGDETSFLRIDPARLKKLGPVVSSDSLTISMVRKNFSLDNLEILILMRNPGIRAQESKLRASVETFSQVSNLDEILRRYTALTEGVMPGIGPMKGKDSIKMKFPFPGVLALKGEIVSQEVKAARETLEITRRDVVTQARKAYWNLVFIRKSRKITGETVKLFRRLESVATIRYKAGKTSYQDVIKVKIRRKILEEDLRTLKEKQRNLESKIVELLNLSPDVRPGVPKGSRPDGKTPSTEALFKLARERRQELRRMRAVIGKMERMTEMAETMILPPYTLNLSLYEDEAVMQAGSLAMKENFPVSVSASRGAGLPKMPWYGTNDAYLRQTRQKLLSLRQELEKAETVTATMVRNAWFELDRAKREAALNRNTIVDLSKSALDVSTRGYESGTVSFADVIGSYTTWLKVRLALERKKSDIGVAKAQLEKVIGMSLE
ncbi:MAG: TolC family protein [Desulfobacteraceae bacterium]|nr:TolC family protein [Desulfobacteraceae bacterium]